MSSGLSGLTSVKSFFFAKQTPIALTPKAFDTLLALVESPGHILEKDELMKKVWPDTVVEENNLTQNISALRKALGRNSGENALIETIPRRGYRFAAAVQERWEEIPPPVLREPAASTVPEREESKRPHRTAWVLLGAIVAVTVMGVVIYSVYNWRRSSHRSTSLSPVTLGGRPRPSVAVLDLRNLTPQPGAVWLSTALPEMLTSELAAGEQLRAVPGENIARMKLSFPPAQRDGLAQDTLGRIRAVLGADYVVLGSYAEQSGRDGDGQIRLDLRLQDARGGDTLTAFAETGTERDLFDLVSRAGARLRQALGAGGCPARDVDEVRAELPSSPAVAKLYADGLGKLRNLDAVNARAMLERAVAADPQFPLAHSALAAALSNLGYDVRARDEAGRKPSNSLAACHAKRGWLLKAATCALPANGTRLSPFTRLYSSLFPDNVDYGIGLLATQMSTGRNDDVLLTLCPTSPAFPSGGRRSQDRLG